MDLDFFKIIDKGTKAVPETKYGVGILGLITVVALVKLGIKDLNVAVWGTVILLALMFLLVIFAKFTQTAKNEFKIPVKIIMWVLVFLFIICCTFLLTSSFFGWPQLHSLYKEQKIDTSKSITILKPIKDTIAKQNIKRSGTNIKITRSPKSNVVVGNGNTVTNEEEK